MSLEGKTVKFTLTVRKSPRSKKFVDREYQGVVKELTKIGNRDVAVVQVGSFANGGFTVSQLVNVEKLALVE